MRKIKDPYFEIFSRGGNVEKSISADPKANGETKKKLIQLAKDEADIKFDLELEIIKQLEDNFKEFGKPGETISDFIKRAPLDELIKLELQGGGKVISISDYLKQEEKRKIKKIGLAQGDFNKTVAGLSDSYKALIKDLLRKSGVLVGD